MLAQQILNGLVSGMVYALFALGLTFVPSMACTACSTWRMARCSPGGHSPASIA